MICYAVVIVNILFMWYIIVIFVLAKIMYNCNTHWIVNKSKGSCLNAIEYTYILGFYIAIESVYTNIWILTSSTVNIMSSNRKGLFVANNHGKVLFCLQRLSLDHLYSLESIVS